MTEQNEHIFKILQKELSSQGEDFYLSTSKIISYYKKHNSEISDRLAREISSRLYPDLPKGVKKKHYLAKQVAKKYILSNLRGDSLEDVINPWHLEKIQGNLRNNGMDIKEDAIEEIVREEYPKIASDWLSGDFSQRLGSITEKMSNSLQTLTELKALFSKDIKEAPVRHTEPFHGHRASSGYRLSSAKKFLAIRLRLRFSSASQLSCG